MNQHGLSLVDLRRIDERLPGRRRGQRHGGGLFEVNVLRLERHLSLFRSRKLGVTAAAHDRQVSVNRIASLELRCLGSCFFDHACDVIADDHRSFVQSSPRQHSLPHVRIDRIHPGRNHTDKDLVISRLRPRHLLQF